MTKSFSNRGATLTETQRQRIIDKHLKQPNASYRELARQTGFDRRSISAVIYAYEQKHSTKEPFKVTKVEGTKVTVFEDLRPALITRLRNKASTLDELAQQFGSTRGQILDQLDELKRSGLNLCQFGDSYAIERHSPAGTSSYAHPSHLELVANNGEYLIGCVGDSHLGSKYERLDVLHDLYDIYEKEGVTNVYHCGNWIEGEFNKNKFDIHVYGMDNQLDYFIKNYPQRKNITTYYVAGDDHEGWYSQREGVEIGRYLELKAAKAGRSDLVYLGYMEAFINLRHDRTGESAKMLVCHPGGGSSYADSYVIQKIIESYEGGEKPGVAFYGHYHKMGSGEYRNVWWAQVGCGKDQDPWARKKRLRYVVGGTLNWFKQDERGYIPRFRSEMLRYFNKNFYNNQWSHSGEVTKAPMRPVGQVWG